MTDELPAQIGAAEFGTLGRWITLRCPAELAPLVRKAGVAWEPERRLWLVERRRIRPLIRALRAATDPLLRHAGIDLDQD